MNLHPRILSFAGVAVALAVLSLFVNAAQDSVIYKTTNADGTVTYSDTPSPGAVEVRIHVPTSTITASAPVVSNIQTSGKKTNVQYVVNIISPEHEATVRSNTGEVTIVSNIEPKIGGFFQLNINGQVHESATGMFKLSNLDRGSYQYTVKFIDNSGKVIATSEPRTLFLHKASSLFKK